MLEMNGTNFIAENERSGSARSLFWPWAAANVSLLALSYGAFFLGFGIQTTFCFTQLSGTLFPSPIFFHSLPIGLAT